MRGRYNYGTKGRKPCGGARTGSENRFPKLHCCLAASHYQITQIISIISNFYQQIISIISMFLYLGFNMFLNADGCTAVI